MDTLTLTLHEAIVRVLQEFREFLGEDPDAIVQLVVDSEGQHYLLVETGWQRRRRIYGVLIHIDIIDGKIWIQHDGTETGIANELVDLGISKDKIVLAYKSLERRKITEFAVS